MTSKNGKYECSICGAKNVKLWREYQTIADCTDLYCVDCAEKDQGKKCTIPNGDQIGWLIPAVPDVLPPEKFTTYWGYTSVPPEGCSWWTNLHLRPEPRKKHNNPKWVKWANEEMRILKETLQKESKQSSYYSKNWLDGIKTLNQVKECGRTIDSHFHGHFNLKSVSEKKMIRVVSDNIQKIEALR